MSRTSRHAAMPWDEDAAGGPGNPAGYYQRYLVPGIFRPCAMALVGLAPPSREDRVLDVGCGTGVVALLAAEQVGRAGSISAVDVNPGMLEVARTLPRAERVEWRQGDAAALPYPDASFDLVYCQQMLQFVPDRRGALGEMHRVLAPGGRSAIAVWGGIDRSPGYGALETALGRYGGPDAAAEIRAPFSLSDAGELASLMEEAGFVGIELHSRQIEVRVPSAEEWPRRVLPALAAVGPATARMGPAEVGRVVAEVTVALTPYQGEDGLVLPMESHIAVGLAG